MPCNEALALPLSSHFNRKPVSPFVAGGSIPWRKIARAVSDPTDETNCCDGGLKSIPIANVRCLPMTLPWRRASWRLMGIAVCIAASIECTGRRTTSDALDGGRITAWFSESIPLVLLAARERAFEGRLVEGSGASAGSLCSGKQQREAVRYCEVNVGCSGLGVLTKANGQLVSSCCVPR